MSDLWVHIQKYEIMGIIDFMLIIFLCFLLFRYLRGSVAFYILFGLFCTYFLCIILHKFGFHFVSDFIHQTTQYGIILLAIIFQPELRNILLTVGNNQIAKQLRRFKNKVLDKEITEKNKLIVASLTEAIEYLSKNYIGATIVIFEAGDISTIANSGVAMNSVVSSKLIESIFVKDSPLHDGALIIQDGLIRAAACTLPVSENLDTSNSRVGLRHKSAVGVTEIANSLSIIVSETTSKISYAREGRLYLDKNIGVIANQIQLILNT